MRVFFKPNHRLLLRGLAAQLGQLTVHARCYVPAPLTVLLVNGFNKQTSHYDSINLIPKVELQHNRQTLK